MGAARTARRHGELVAATTDLPATPRVFAPVRERGEPGSLSVFTPVFVTHADS